MPVLAEGISVIVRQDAIARSYPGGVRSFVADCPNRTFCADNSLARVGFMAPDDVLKFVTLLEEKGLTFQGPRGAVDIVVVDQSKGPTSPCDWLEVDHVDLGGDRWLTACRLRGDRDDTLTAPDGWTYEGSLSHRFGLVALPDASGSIEVIQQGLSGNKGRTSRTYGPEIEWRLPKARRSWWQKLVPWRGSTRKS